MLKGEQIKKASRLEESSKGIKLPQAKIEIEESVKVHVEEEISKEDFYDSMSDMSFEEEESIEIERKDRVEEKARLLGMIPLASLEDHLLPRCNSLLEDSFDGCSGKFEEHKQIVGKIK